MTEPDELPEADPMIEEIRRIRRDISDQFGNDVRRLAAHLREFEARFADRVVQPPARIEARKAE
jgi:hypothetical protein